MIMWSVRTDREPMRPYIHGALMAHQEALVAQQGPLWRDRGAFAVLQGTLVANRKALGGHQEAIMAW